MAVFYSPHHLKTTGGKLLIHQDHLKHETVQHDR